MKNILKKTNIIRASILSLVMILGACTDLEIEETDSIITEGFQGVEDPASFIDGAYNDINFYIGDQTNLYSITEVTTDEQLIPTRGSDWGDNGIWRQLHQHSWTPDHQYITNNFNQWNSIQLVGSQLLDERTDASAEQKAQGSFLRALGVFIILDSFGQVPFRDTQLSSNEIPEVMQPQEAVDMIVSDLENAIANLGEINPGAETRRAGKAAARYLLAKVLLNKHIYLGESSPNSADMDRVVSLVDAISASGFALEDSYFEIFKSNPDNETILYVETSKGNRIWQALHYNQNTPDNEGGGWNGFATLSEFYDLFEGDPNINVEGSGQEERRGFVPTSGLPIGAVPDGVDEDGDGLADGSHIGFGFLINQQYDLDGTPLSDRAGAPLAYTREFFDSETGESSLVNNNEVSGIRLQKYNPRFGGSFVNHEIFFRYSDAYLMKAEAIFRSGGDPTVMINELRTLRGATPLGSVTEQDILNERGRELYMELWRRNDLIRFGQYTRDWEFKDPEAINNPDKRLFPIPASQLVLNPNLVQNPGY